MDFREMELPITTIKRRLTIWPIRCGVTGQTIPMFRMARKRWREVVFNGEILTDFDWVSNKGYTYLILTKKPGEIFHE